MSIFNEFLAVFSEEQTASTGVIGQVVSVAPLSVQANGLIFDAAQIQRNALLSLNPEDETALRPGSRVLCATLDGWQTVFVICEVT